MKTTKLISAMMFLLAMTGLAGCSSSNDDSGGGDTPTPVTPGTTTTVKNNATDQWGMTDNVDRTAVETFINYAFKVEYLRLQTFKMLSNGWEGDLLSGVGPKSDPTKLFEIARDLSLNYKTDKEAAESVWAMMDVTPVTRLAGAEELCQAGYDMYTYHDRKSEEIKDCLSREHVYKDQKAMDELYSFLPNSVKHDTNSSNEWFTNFRNGEYDSDANAIRNAWYDAGSKFSGQQKYAAAELFANDIEETYYKGKDPQTANMLEVGGMAVTSMYAIEIMALDAATAYQLSNYTGKIEDIGDIYKETTKLIDKIQKGTATEKDLISFGAVMGSKVAQEHFGNLFPKGTSKTAKEIASTVASYVMKRGVTAAQEEAAKGIGVNIMEIIDNIPSMSGAMTAFVRDPRTGTTTIGLASDDGNVRVVIDTQPDGTNKLTVVKSNGSVTQEIDATGKITKYNAMPDGSKPVLKVPSSVHFYNWNGETKTVSIYSNYKHFEITPCDWCSAVYNNGTLSLTATANKTGKKRTGKIIVTGVAFNEKDVTFNELPKTINVEQDPEQEITLSATPPKLDLTFESQKKKITVTTTLPFITNVKATEKWVIPTATGKEVTVEILQNGGLDKRKATIIIDAGFSPDNAAKSIEVPVTQASMSDAGVTVEPSDPVLFKAAGGDATVTMNYAGYSFVDVEVPKDAKEWLGATLEHYTYSETSGIYINGLVTITAKPNTGKKRTAQILCWGAINSDDPDSERSKAYITVEQEGATYSDPWVKPTSLTFSADGGEIPIEYFNGGYPYFRSEVEDSAKGWLESWFGAAASGTTNYTVTIIASPNTSTTARSATITYWASDVENPTESQKKKVTLTVTQEGKTGKNYSWIKDVSMSISKCDLYYKGNQYEEGIKNNKNIKIPINYHSDYYKLGGHTDVTETANLIKVVYEYNYENGYLKSCKIELDIDPVKKIVTKISAKERDLTFADKPSGDHYVLTIEAANIPLKTEKSNSIEAVGSNKNGATLIKINEEGKSGWAEWEQYWPGSGDYEITVKLLE